MLVSWVDRTVTVEAPPLEPEQAAAAAPLLVTAARQAALGEPYEVDAFGVYDGDVAWERDRAQHADGPEDW